VYVRQTENPKTSWDSVKQNVDSFGLSQQDVHCTGSEQEKKSMKKSTNPDSAGNSAVNPVWV